MLLGDQDYLYILLVSSCPTGAIIIDPSRNGLRYLLYVTMVYMQHTHHVYP